MISGYKFGAGVDTVIMVKYSIEFILYYFFSGFGL
jgi:hypothetical protein